MPDVTQLSGRAIDLSPRFAVSTTVVASPTAGSETVIGQVNMATGLNITAGVVVQGWTTITIGTNGVSVRLRIRQTSISGTIVADSGVVTAGIAATNVTTQDCGGFDTSPPAGGVYVLTALVGAASAASTVGALLLLVNPT